MPVTVHDREVPDADLHEVVSDPSSLLCARIGIVDKRPIATVDHIRSYAHIHGTEISPVLFANWGRGLSRPTVVKAEKMIIDLEHAHVHCGRVGASNIQKCRERCQ